MDENEKVKDAEDQDQDENLLDTAIEKSGMKHRYQIIMLILTFSVYMNCDALSISFPYLETQPVVVYYDNSTGRNVTVTLDYDLCESGLNYTQTKIDGHSWVSEFGVECDRFAVSLIGFLIFAGGVLGSITAPIMSDSIGRRKTILISVFGYAFFIFLSTLMHNFYVVLVVNIATMYFAQVTCNTSLLLLNEITDTNWRSTFSAIVNVGDNIGGFTIIFLYFITDSWRIVFTIIASFCVIIDIVYLLYSKESHRFYIVKKDFIRFLKCIRNIAKKNGKLKVFDEFYYNSELGIKSEFHKQTESETGNDFDEGLAKNTNDLKQEDELVSKSMIILDKMKKRRYTPLDLLRYSSQRTKFLILCFLWFTIYSNYFGTIFNLKNFKANIYVVGVITYAVDTLAFLVSGYLAGKFGRKRTILVSLFVAVVTFSITEFVELEDVIKFIFAYVSRFCIANVYNILCVYSIELYPTVVRGLGFGINMACSQSGSLVIPIVVEYFPKEINLIFAVINAFNFLFTWFLPETLGKDLQDFIPELCISQEMMKDSSRVNSDDQD